MKAVIKENTVDSMRICPNCKKRMNVVRVEYQKCECGYQGVGVSFDGSSFTLGAIVAGVGTSLLAGLLYYLFKD